MGKRLTQIATRTGDDGTTGLGDNTRVSKDSLRVHAMGDVDELNSHIGLLLCETLPGRCADVLVEVQHQLFNLGGELSIPGFELLKPEAVLALDQALAELQRGAAQAAGVHPAGRYPRRVAGPCLPHRGASGRARGGGAAGPRRTQTDAAPVPEPAQRPDVRAGAGAQPPPRRWQRGRRCVLEERAAGAPTSSPGPPS
jgi:hypothetical protein